MYNLHIMVDDFAQLISSTGLQSISNIRHLRLDQTNSHVRPLKIKVKWDIGLPSLISKRLLLYVWACLDKDLLNINIIIIAG